MRGKDDGTLGLGVPEKRGLGVGGVPEREAGCMGRMPESDAWV